jgi:hypothetical protein
MKMLFILGYRRSATTALQQQLQAHPSMQYFDGGVLPGGRARNECHLFDLIDRAPAEYEALFRHHCGGPPSGNSTADAEALFARCTRPVGLIKSTRLLMSARAWQRFKAWAAATAHEVWLLGIARFPLDTLSSDHKNFAALALPHDRVLRLETAQEVWSEAYRRLLDDAGFAKAVKRLRVEDVVDRPHQQIQAVADWLGIAPYASSPGGRPTAAAGRRTRPSPASRRGRPPARSPAAWGTSCRVVLDCDCASFETRPAGAPQDEAEH